MDTDTFDRLTCLFGSSRTRRSALSALLGTVVPGIASKSAAGKGKRRGKGKGKAKRNDTVQAEKKAVRPCLSPFGVNLNALYGVSEQIVARFCPRLDAGQHWRTPTIWIVNAAFEVEPEGFVRAGETPLEDFAAKLEQVKVVIDPGTQQEKTIELPNDGNLWTGPASLAGGAPDDVLVNPITLGKVQPQRVGEHEVEVYWALSAMHCDGRGAGINPTNPFVGNCIPAGEWFYVGFPFEVVPGHH